jgi:DNA-binding response OmpR family regulator
MHRTQLLLEPWQHEALKAAAERQGKSMSEVLRHILDDYLQRPAASRAGLARIRGIGRDTRSRGRDHDDVLYGSK